MKPIFLLGYMGCGKTTVGKNIAGKMGLEFLDTDDLIEKCHRKTIAEIFSEVGENQFREMEREVLHNIFDYNDCIISTGGGMPCFFDNLALMNEKGTTIFLDVSIEELVHRLYYKGNKRPLLQGKNEQQLYEYIKKSIEERLPFYSQAQIRISADNTNATIDRILQLLG
ncbi:MAG: shikimate kinase [Paludibacteraceae bacterium]